MLEKYALRLYDLYKGLKYNCTRVTLLIWMEFTVQHDMYLYICICVYKVHVFKEGHKNWQNLHRQFDVN